MVVQDDDGSLVDRQAVERALDPVPIRQRGRRVFDCDRFDVGHHVQLDESPALVAADLVEAGPDREAMQPGIPRVGVTERAQPLPGRDERLLDRVLGAVPSRRIERGDGVLARCGRPHQVGEGIPVAPDRPLHERSLHGHHRCGTAHPAVLSS